MGKKFKSIGELEHFLENKVNAALDTTVKQGVIDGLKGYALEDVYNIYWPTSYERRYSLFEDSNYEVQKPKSMKLTITPVAKFNPSVTRWNKKSHSYYPSISNNGYGDELAGLINYGDGWNGYEYEFKTDEEMANPTYTAPRPFIDDTREDLNTGSFKTLLADGLEELGVKINWK